MKAKYLSDGRKVVVIGQLNNVESIVQEIFVSESGDQIPSGEKFTTKSLHDEPVKPWKQKEAEKFEARYNKMQLEIKDIEKEISSKIPDLTKIFEQKKIDIRAEVYRGVESLKALHEEILEYKECYWIGGNSSVELTALKHWFYHWMEKRAKKQVMMYDLVDYGTYLKGYEPEKIEYHKKKYYKYCQLPQDLSSPMVIVIFGNKVGQILWAKQPFAFVLESQNIKDSFMKYFNYFWKDPW